MTGTTFSRVSYDMPGSYQRFSRNRAVRDAEDRAANEIAENINTRLASFFTAGTSIGLLPRHDDLGTWSHCAEKRSTPSSPVPTRAVRSSCSMVLMPASCANAPMR